MILKSKRLTLVPLRNFEYFIQLAEEDNKGKHTREEVESLINDHCGEFWVIDLGGIPRGVIGYFKINCFYVMEALKDHSAPPTGISFSIEAGRLLLDYMFKFTDKIRTCARVEDKSIQILCTKLGFKTIFEKDGYLIYEREMKPCL